MRGIWSWGATATSIATTAKGNFATSLSGIDVSPLEYVPASRSPVRSRERSDRVGAGVWLSLGLPAAEKSPFGVALIEGGTKSAVVRSALGPGKVKRRTSMYGFPCTRLKRSEEHTSELQSRLHLVCRLLLEKKKNTCSVINPKRQLESTQTP